MQNLYGFLLNIFFPFIVILIYFRKIIGKEDSKRFKEKIFIEKKIKKNKKNNLIWFHAASIGEVLSIIPLIKKIQKKKSKVEFLVTTTTLSSSKLIAKESKNIKNLHHKFLPIDSLKLVKNFLDNWKPKLAIFVDSEIWPNFLFEIKKKKVPLVLINGRITKKTFNRWLFFSTFAKKIFNTFDLCFASSAESKKSLEYLRGKKVKYFGNLKFSSNYKNLLLDKKNIKVLNNYKTWCAASIHEGEELFCLLTHIEVKKLQKNLLTIIIPRHTVKSKIIKKQSEKLNLNVQVINEGEKIKKNLDVLVVNSFGVSAKYFNYCKNIFIGKSMIPSLSSVGGQNPIEAAKLGCKIYHGKYIYNFQEVYDFLRSNQICSEVTDVNQFKNVLLRDFDDTKKINKKTIKKLNIYGNEILNKTLNELKKFLK